jgi:hypothetical protein
VLTMPWARSEVIYRPTIKLQYVIIGSTLIHFIFIIL